MKKRILALLLTLLTVTPISAETFSDGKGISNIYPETGIVTEIETISETETLLTITVANGNQFQCVTLDCDWYINDFASMIMDNNGTEIVYDDEILKVEYSGVIEHFIQYVK